MLCFEAISQILSPLRGGFGGFYASLEQSMQKTSWRHDEASGPDNNMTLDLMHEIRRDQNIGSEQ